MIDVHGIIEEIHQRAYHDELPEKIDAIDLAERLGHDVYESNSPGYSDEDGDIFVSISQRPERVQWTVAHEILEQRIIWRIKQMVDDVPWPVMCNEAHKLAAAHASKLLLPPTPFFSHCQETNCDLFELKKRFPHVSHEVITREIIHYLTDRQYPALAVIVDRPKGAEIAPIPYLRLATPEREIKYVSLRPFELEIIKSLDQTAEPIHRSEEIDLKPIYAGHAETRAWPIFEPEYRRYITLIEGEDL